MSEITCWAAKSNSRSRGVWILGHFDLWRHFLEPEFQLGRTPGGSLDPGLVGVTLSRIGSATELFRDVATFD